MSAESMPVGMNSDRHQGQSDDGAAAPKCCIFGLCAIPASLAATQGYVLAPGLVARVSFPPFGLAGPLSRTVSPDLRPPIA
jgi:hypothetical protein